MALLSTALVLPAIAQASNVQVVRVGPSELKIVYSDTASALDLMQLLPALENGDPSRQTILFAAQPDGELPTSIGDIPCSEPPGSRECLAADVSLLVLLTGGGDDWFDLSVLPAPAVGESRAIPSEMTAGAGDDEFTGSVNKDVFDGGPGNDTVNRVSGPDRYIGGDGIDTLDLSVGGPWVVTLDGIANDGRQAAPVANIEPDVEVITAGPLADTLTGTGGAQSLSGGGGADTLDAGPDPDTVDAGAGDDTILARDGAVDTIICGTGVDTVTADGQDAVAADCENVSLSVRDDDNDGAAHDADCNDTDPTIKPGAVDVPGNGIDEDCSGADAVPAPSAPVDRDRDGFTAPADCHDGNEAVHPGAVDVRGNGIDEDCNGRDAPLGTFAFSWDVFANGTLITKLNVKNARRGSTVLVSCSGSKRCPFKRKSVELKSRKAKLTKLFKRTRLRPGAVVTVRLTSPGRMGKVLRLTIRKRKEPKRSSLCLAPSAREPHRCA